MKPKHTPGPWKMSVLKFGDRQSNTEDGLNGLIDRYIVTADARAGLDLVTVDAQNGTESEANAHLIAAAPSMLVALVDAWEMLRTTGADREDLTEIIDAIRRAKGQ